MHGEDPLRRDHPVDVVRRRLPADEDNRPVLRALDRRVGIEDDAAARRTRRRVQAGCGNVELCGGIDHRMEQLVELRGIDTGNCLFTADQPLVDHRRRRFQRRGRRALRSARLQEIELPVLDGELDVLHVTVVLLEPADVLDEFLERLRHRIAHRLERLRRPDAGDDVFTLRVREELAEDARLARRRVACERDARA